MIFKRNNNGLSFLGNDGQAPISLPTDDFVANKGIIAQYRPDNMQNFWRSYGEKIQAVLEAEKSPLRAEDFVEAAQMAYSKTGKIVPWELALAQAKVETEYGKKGDTRLTNPFGIKSYSASLPMAKFTKGSAIDRLIDGLLQLPAYQSYSKDDFLRLLGTVEKVESRGKNIRQIGGGPGRGYYQIETTTLPTAKNRLALLNKELKLGMDLDLGKDTMDYDKDMQAALALANMHKAARARNTYLIPIDPETTWLNFHWAGPNEQRDQRIQQFRNANNMKLKEEKSKFNSSQEGIQSYYDIMATKYLKEKTPKDLVSTTAAVSNSTYDPKRNAFLDSKGMATMPVYAIEGSFKDIEGKRYSANPYYEKLVYDTMAELQSQLVPMNRKGSKLKRRHNSENKILDGKLHSEKNRLKKKFNFTPKGVPVVSKECDEEGCELVQHAEVEKNELVLSKQNTQFIEKMREAYRSTGSEEVLVQLGQFMKDQLLMNTEDSKDKLLK